MVTTGDVRPAGRTGRLQSESRPRRHDGYCHRRCLGGRGLAGLGWLVPATSVTPERVWTIRNRVPWTDVATVELTGAAVGGDRGRLTDLAERTQVQLARHVGQPIARVAASVGSRGSVTAENSWDRTLAPRGDDRVSRLIPEGWSPSPSDSDVDGTPIRRDETCSGEQVMQRRCHRAGNGSCSAAFGTRPTARSRSCRSAF